MVQQLSLVATIPHNKYIQTVASLQALTGTNVPQEMATYTLLVKPYPEFKPKLEPGKVNQIEQYFMKCTTTWDDEFEFHISKPVTKDENEGIWASTLFADSSGDLPKRNWTLQIADIPTAGKSQSCSAQTIYESTLVHHHTRVEQPAVESAPVVDVALQFEDGLVEEIAPTVKNEMGPKDDISGITETTEKIDVGDNVKIGEHLAIDAKTQESISIDSKKTEPMDVEITTENSKDSKIILTVDIQDKKQDPLAEIELLDAKPAVQDSFLQFLQDLGYDLVNQYWIRGIRYVYGDIMIEVYKVFVRDDDFATQEQKMKLKLLDESNNFQVKVYINVPKATDVELIVQGTKSLARFQEMVKNLIKFEVPDRIYMDSRVHNRD